MQYKLRVGDRTRGVTVERTDSAGRFIVHIDDAAYEVQAVRRSGYHLHLAVDGRRVETFIQPVPGGKRVFSDGGSVRITDSARGETGESAAGAADGTITPPMPAAVAAVLVGEGDMVEAGQPLVKVIAMKMEQTLSAPFGGTVVEVHAAIGAQVMPGDVLMKITREE